MNKHQPVALREPDAQYAPQEVLLSRAMVRRINAANRQQVAQMKDVRVQVAFFRCPWPCTTTQYERVRKAAVDRWVRYMEQTGWQLVSKVQDRPAKRRVATGMRGNWYSVPLLDSVEIPVGAAFRKLNMQIVRTEVPVADDEGA